MQYCIEISMGCPFDVLTESGQLLPVSQKIVIPFDTRESAETALARMSLSVQDRADSYKPVIQGEVVGDSAFIAGIIERDG